MRNIINNLGGSFVSKILTDKTNQYFSIENEDGQTDVMWSLQNRNTIRFFVISLSIRELIMI